MASYVATKKSLLELGRSMGLEGVNLTQFINDEYEQMLKLEREREERANKNREEEIKLEREREERENKKREEEMNFERERREEEMNFQREKDKRKEEEDVRERERLQIQLELARANVHIAEVDRDRATSSPQTVTSEPSNDPSMTFPLDTFNSNVETIDDFLDKFESLAQFHNLQKDKWPLKLSIALRGTAYQLYSSLPPVEKNDYECVKSTLFRHFQVTGENYRKKFSKS